MVRSYERVRNDLIATHRSPIDQRDLRLTVTSLSLLARAISATMARASEKIRAWRAVRDLTWPRCACTHTPTPPDAAATSHDHTNPVGSVEPHSKAASWTGASIRGTRRASANVRKVVERHGEGNNGGKERDRPRKGARETHGPRNNSIKRRTPSN